MRPALVLLLLVSLNLYAQKETSHWFPFNNHLKVDKNTGVSNITTPTPDYRFWPNYASTSLSDPAGNLLFASDGNTVIDRNGQLMPGVTAPKEMKGDNNTVLSVPFPGNPSRHYLFYSQKESGPTFNLRYAIIDMNANGGKGDVISYGHQVGTALSRGFTVCVIPNSNEFWIVTHKYMSKDFYAYKVTAAGINTTPIHSTAGGHSVATDYRFEDLRTSPDGTMIAGFSYADYTVIFAETWSFLEVFDFNATTGGITSKIMSNRQFGYFYPYNSVEFSPDSRLVYLCRNSSSRGLQPCDFGSSNLIQYNLCYTNPDDFTKYSVLVSSYYGWCDTRTWGKVQLGADRKLHIPFNISTIFSSLDYPNRIGTSSTSNFYAHSLVTNTYQSNTSFNHYYIAKAVKSNIRYRGGCYPDPVSFSITNDTIGSAQWNFGDPASASNSSSSLTPQHSFTAPGVYTVTADIYTAGGVFIEKLEEKIEIKDPAKRLLFEYPKDTSLCTGEALSLKQSVINGIFYWYVRAEDGGIYDERVADEFTSTVSGTWIVEMRQNDCNGCIIKDSVKVKFLRKPYVDLGYDRKVCSGDSLLLSVYDEGADYLWNTGKAGAELWVKQPGKYYVDAEFDNNGCLSTDTITITAAPALNYKLPADTTLCDGDELVVTPGVPNSYAYWNDAFYGNSISITAPGTYWVKLMNFDGCFVEDTMTVEFKNSPAIFIGNDTVLCSGGKFKISAASAAGTYQWSTGETTPEIVIAASGTYSVEVNDGTCIADDEINVSFRPLPVVDLGGDVSLCEGTTIRLNAGNAAGMVTWNDLSTDRSKSVQLPGIYWVTIDNSGCIASDTVVVTFKPFPIVDIGNDTTICEDGTLVVGKAIAGADYLWQDKSTKPFYSINKPGIYWLKVNKDGCEAADTVKIAFKELPEFSLGPDKEICNDQTILINPSVTDADYLWENGSKSPDRNITAPGTYYLKGSNYCGSYTDTLLITQGICEFALPNAFTPNNDGTNDAFKVRNSSRIKNFKLLIFNRWGQLVFSTYDAGKGWDGTFAGKIQPEGNYMYTVSVTDIDGQSFTASGWVLLIR
jgi:gliding motility-associated-like protein